MRLHILILAQPCSVAFGQMTVKSQGAYRDATVHYEVALTTGNATGTSASASSNSAV